MGITALTCEVRARDDGIGGTNRRRNSRSKGSGQHPESNRINNQRHLTTHNLRRRRVRTMITLDRPGDRGRGGHGYRDASHRNSLIQAERPVRSRPSVEHRNCRLVLGGRIVKSGTSTGSGSVCGIGSYRLKGCIRGRQRLRVEAGKQIIRATRSPLVLVRGVARGGLVDRRRRLPEHLLRSQRILAGGCGDQPCGGESVSREQNSLLQSLQLKLSERPHVPASTIHPDQGRMNHLPRSRSSIQNLPFVTPAELAPLS